MSTAIIDYTGIIGFHPKRNSMGAITSLLALAPNAKTHRPQPHDCWLRVLSPPPSVGGNVTPKTMACDDGTNRFLLNEMMTLNGVSPSASLNPGAFFQKLVPLEKSDSEAAARRLDKLLKAKRKHPSVSLWSDLTAGTFTAIKYGGPCHWRFTHWDDDVEPIPLAQVVRQEVELAGSELELHFERRRDQFYTPTLSSESGPIHVEIGNTPDPCKSVGTPTDPDHHVKLYNLLAKKKKPMGALSHLTCVARDVGGTDDVDGANCPPGWWENSA